jgi:hypothetical protein
MAALRVRIMRRKENSHIVRITPRPPPKIKAPSIGGGGGEQSSQTNLHPRSGILLLSLPWGLSAFLADRAILPRQVAVVAVQAVVAAVVAAVSNSNSKGSRLYYLVFSSAATPLPAVPAVHPAATPVRSASCYSFRQEAPC